MLDDESEYNWSDSGSAGTCAFTFCFDESVGHVGEYVVCVDDLVGSVSGMGSGFFVLKYFESIGDVFLSVAIIPKGV